LCRQLEDEKEVKPDPRRGLARSHTTLRGV
jgi:hypothetical protein